MNIRIYYNEHTFCNQNEFNIYLLYEYLIKHFEKQGNNIEISMKCADKLIKKYSNNLFGKDSLSVYLGGINFEYYCKHFLQDFFIPKSNNTSRKLADVHIDIWNELQNIFILDKYDKEEFILPRGCSKTTIINKAATCFNHCYRKSIYTIVIGNKTDDSVQFIGDTKQMLKNRFIIEGFGDLVNENDKGKKIINKQEIELENDTKIRAFSLHTSIRGTTFGCKGGIYRPTLIISDDMISQKDILSANAKEKILTKYYKEIQESGDEKVVRNGKVIKPATKFLIIGTPLAQDCFINSIRQDATFKIFHKKVVDFDIDKYFKNNKYWQQYKGILLDDEKNPDNKKNELNLFYNNNKKHMEFKTIWNKYSCQKIFHKYTINRIAFMQELMCETENIGNTWIHTMYKLPSNEILNKECEKTTLTVDQATTNNKHSDYTSFTVLGKNCNGFYYVKYGSLKKYDSINEFDLYIREMENILSTYTDIDIVVLEKNTYKGVDGVQLKKRIESNNELRKRHIKIEYKTNTENKDVRISTITGKINNGIIKFNQDCKEYNNQIKLFRGQMYTENDDAIDNLETAVNSIDSMEDVPRVKILDYNDVF